MCCHHDVLQNLEDGVLCRDIPLDILSTTCLFKNNDGIEDWSLIMGLQLLRIHKSLCFS